MISTLILENLRINQNSHLIATKLNNKWIWRDKKYILDSIQYCREFLQSENIEKGDRVAYKGANSVEWLAWNVACNSLGGIWVPMYHNQSDDYCNHIVNDCSPKLFITDQNPKLETNMKIIHNDVEPKQYEESDAIQNDVSTLIYTSGTTGKPKGVMLSNENIISNINDIQTRFPDLKNTTCLNILPWAHIYSQTCELYYNVINDNKIALCSTRENFIKELKEIQPDVLYVVPRVLELIKSKVDFLDYSILSLVLPLILKRIFGKHLSIFFVGGAKLQSSTKEFFTKYGYVICEGYGCTELSPMVCVNHMENPRNENSIGKLLDSVIVDIIDEEIQVSGPNVMLGYWNNPEETDKVLVNRDGKTWYKTGDGGYVEDGFLFYTGRMSDNYKLSNGKFVNVENIETIVKEHVKCNCVVFTRDNIQNEIIVSESISDETLQSINQKLSKYSEIKQIHVMEEKKWEKYYTPKMSIKKKLLIQEFVK